MIQITAQAKNSGAVNRRVFVYHTGLKRRIAGYRFKYGTGRVLPADGPIQQGAGAVEIQAGPFSPRHPPSQRIRIIGRIRPHHDHFAVVHVESHHHAIVILHEIRGIALCAQIDRQRQILSDARHRLIQRAALAAAGVHFYRPFANGTAQNVFIIFFYAGLTDHVAADVAFVFTSFDAAQLLFGNLAHVPHHMGSQGAGRVGTAPHRQREQHFGKFRIFHQAGHLQHRQIRDQRNSPIRSPVKVFDALFEFFRIVRQTGTLQSAKQFLFDLVALQVQRIAHDIKSHHVQRQRQSLTVIDLSASRRHADQPKAVFQRQPYVAVGPEHLKKRQRSS